MNVLKYPGAVKWMKKMWWIHEICYYVILKIKAILIFAYVNCCILVPSYPTMNTFVTTFLPHCDVLHFQLAKQRVSSDQTGNPIEPWAQINLSSFQPTCQAFCHLGHMLGTFTHFSVLCPLTCLCFLQNIMAKWHARAKLLNAV